MSDARDDLRPTAGARYLLERGAIDADGRRARYRARIVTPDASFAYDAELIAGEEPALTASGDAAPPELEATLVMLARLTARGVDKKLEAGQAAWPDRVLRWRGPGRGG